MKCPGDSCVRKVIRGIDSYILAYVYQRRLMKRYISPA